MATSVPMMEPELQGVLLRTGIHSRSQPEQRRSTTGYRLMAKMVASESTPGTICHWNASVDTAASFEPPPPSGPPSPISRPASAGRLSSSAHPKAPITTVRTSARARIGVWYHGLKFTRSDVASRGHPAMRLGIRNLARRSEPRGLRRPFARFLVRGRHRHRPRARPSG